MNGIKSDKVEEFHLGKFRVGFHCVFSLLGYHDTKSSVYASYWRVLFLSKETILVRLCCTRKRLDGEGVPDFECSILTQPLDLTPINSINTLVGNGLFSV